MFTRNLSTSCEFVSLLANTSIVYNTATYSAQVDTAGYQTVALVMVTSPLAAANTPVLSAVYGTTSAANAATTNTAVASSSVPVGLNTTLQVLELARPSKRYIQAVVTGGAGVTGANTPVNVFAILAGREPQMLGQGNPLDNMQFQNSSFNTTTGVFGGVADLQSSANTPTSKLLLANP